jgi:3'5'-cyclic nucleotide phosphodiesterase
MLNMSTNREGVITPYAALALALSVGDWHTLGTETIEKNPDTGSTDDITILSDRLTSLLLVRIAAIVNHFEYFKAHEKGKTSHCPHFADYSTSTICRTVLVQQEPWEYFAPGLTEAVIEQLRNFVETILSGYNNVPYHNREHAYHVVLSAHKLMDMMLSLPRTETKTFGLRDDPTKLCALIFAALIHDVEHLGIPNRQMLLDRYHLAILYNDQSIAENRSIYIAFATLLEDESFCDLRNIMFNENLDSDMFRTFRQTVINIVLQTDIASSERVQIGKSKWKEAFGEPFETLERKVLRSMGTSDHNSVQHSTVSSVLNRPRAGSNDSFVSDSDTPTEFDEDDEDEDYENDDSDGIIISGKVGNGMATTNKKVQQVETELKKELSLKTIESVESPMEKPNKSSQKFSKSQFSATDLKTEEDLSSKADIDYGYDDSGKDELFCIARGTINVQQYAEVEHNSEEKSDATEIKSNSTPGVSFKPMAQRKCSLDSFLSPKQKKERRFARGSIGCDNTNSKRMSLPSIASNEKFRRRMSTRHSAPESTLLSYRKRLGIRRSMDLSGEAIEVYQKRQSIGPNNDLPDDLKASVVLETILTAADVAHNLQGWTQMRKWSGKLYLELRRAFVQGKGIDPRLRWYENQIGFLESYLLPLARRLEDTGVFGFDEGQRFVTIVESNRDKWFIDGAVVTKEVIALGDETSFDDSVIYPSRTKSKN